VNILHFLVEVIAGLNTVKKKVSCTKSILVSELFVGVTSVCYRINLHQPRGLRRRSAASRLLGMRVRISQETWVSVSCECCVLLGRGLRDGPIPQREESYRVCVCVCVCVCVFVTVCYEVQQCLSTPAASR
jgi:hypothetical protein